EALGRLNQNLLAGVPLRDPKTGQDNGVRLLDVDNDGYLDGVIGSGTVRQTRVWSPRKRSWVRADFPVALVPRDGHGSRADAGVRFGILRPAGRASCLVRNDTAAGCWHWDGATWVEDKGL